MIVIENVVVFCTRLDPDPDVPVTVTVVVTGVWKLELEEEEPPPQPVNRLSPMTVTASRRNSCTLRRCLHPRKQSAAASAAPGKRGLELGRTAALVAVVVTVSVVEAAAPDGVTVAGEKLQVAPVGSPEQVNETADAKPFCGVTDIVAEPVCPPLMESEDGEATTAKLGDPAGVMV